MTVEEILACPTLPSLPAVAMQVLELTRDEDVMVAEIASCVQNDPALTAKILRTVNSSYYSLSRPCPTIDRAISYLGLATVKSLVLGFSLVKIAGDDVTGFNLTDFWRRCLLSAAGARRLGASNRVDGDEAFVAALMQDVGMLAIHAADAETYCDVIAQTHGDHRRLRQVERQELGFDHAEVGALLGQRWRLPKQMVDAIRHHHDSIGGESTPLVRVVALATEIAAVMGLSNPGPAVVGIRERAQKWFALDADALNALLSEIGEDVRELTKQFDVNMGENLDVNFILAEAQEASVQHQLEMQREAETLRKSNDELSRIAVTDGLTNIGNRKRFDDELAARFEQAQAFSGSVGVILLDADRFKLVNDNYGHQVGDAVLVELAARLKPAIRGADVACRYGGEEFAIVLPGAGLRDVASIAERVRLVVADRRFELDPSLGLDEALPVTISLGAAVYDATTAKVVSTPQLLVKAADRALYVAKDSGRNCVRVFRLDNKKAA